MAPEFDHDLLNRLLSEQGAQLRPEECSRVRTRVVSWAAAMAERHKPVTIEHLAAVVNSNIRDLRFRQLKQQGDLADGWKLVQAQLEAIARARVPLDSVPDLVQQAWQEGLKSYDPDEGTFLGLLRLIVQRLAKAYWGPITVDISELKDLGEPPPELPTSDCFEALLSLVVKEEPHKAIVFILSQVFGMTPKEIDGRFGRLPLLHLMDEIEGLFLERRWNSKAVRRCFETLREALPFPAGERTLASHYTRDAQRNLPAWTGDVWASLRRALVRMQVRFLKLVFSLNCDPHKILTYAYLGLLCWPPFQLWDRRREPLFDLKDEFPTHYPPDELEEDRIENCLRPLSERLEKPRVSPAGRANLADMAGEQRRDALSYWRSEVNRIVCAKAGQDGLRAIAYLNGAVEWKQRREARQ
jgi:DNA-directed RNA polymerase specialized sigma24 family protein